MENNISINTGTSTISAHVDTDDKYPAIWVSVNGEDVARVSYLPVTKKHRVQVWSNESNAAGDDPTVTVDIEDDATNVNSLYINGLYGKGILTRLPDGEISDERKALFLRYAEHMNKLCNVGDIQLPDTVQMDVSTTLTPMHRFFMEFLQRNYVNVDDAKAYEVAKGMEDYFVGTYMPTIASDNDLVQG